MAGLIRRKKWYYAVYLVGNKERRKALGTKSHQVAKAELKKLELRLTRDEEDLFPTKTPLPQIVEAYAAYIRHTKTRSGFRVDSWYLRDIFGPICDILNYDESDSGKRRYRKRRSAARIEVRHIEDLTTRLISEFISERMIRDGIAPKTGNRYREIIARLVNWAVDQRSVRMPGGRNPALKVERYRQSAPEIRFLTLEQIDEQMRVLRNEPLLTAMVATYIYAGLRREEALWLTPDDVQLKQGRYGLLRIRAKTVDGESWQPKTKVNRAIPISRRLREYLDAYQNVRAKSRWYFPTSTGVHWIPDNFSRKLRVANKRVGLPWSCLDYRHTFGSHLAMKGESLYKVSALMGNSPEICRRHYAALIPEAMADTVEFDPGTTGHKKKRFPAPRVIAENGELLEVPQGCKRRLRSEAVVGRSRSEAPLIDFRGFEALGLESPRGEMRSVSRY